MKVIKFVSLNTLFGGILLISVHLKTFSLEKIRKKNFKKRREREREREQVSQTEMHLLVSVGGRWVGSSNSGCFVYVWCTWISLRYNVG